MNEEEYKKHKDLMGKADKLRAEIDDNLKDIEALIAINERLFKQIDKIELLSNDILKLQQPKNKFKELFNGK